MTVLFMLPIPLVISLFIRHRARYKDIWLIAEREDEARDNGYHLFKYIRTQYPHKQVYYVIDFKSRDKQRLEKLGNLVDYLSFKHFLYFVLCSKSISTHLHGAAPMARACIPFYPLMPKKKIVFLDHGIIKDYMLGLHKKFSRINMFICGAKPEYDYIKDKFGYDPMEVQYTGHARFDNLHENSTGKRQILLMPTFRKWLYNLTRLPHEIGEEEFKKDQFYVRYQSLLINESLMEALDKYNYNLIYFPHSSAQDFLHVFESIHPRIILASRDNHDIQDLLLQSRLLITDYSSVFFDFAYMHKPVLYYQFDTERYRSQHYQQGYFEYKTHGFGPVVSDENDVIDKVISYMQSEFAMEPEYVKRASAFFPLRDNNNCSRIFSAICAM